MAISARERADAILDFWFGADDDPGYAEGRELWFKGGAEVDAMLRERFLSDYERAVAGAYDDWATEPRTCLALIILLDQFPRSMFRGDKRSFAADPKALALAKEAVDSGLTKKFRPVENCFVYLPFEHSEDLADQKRAVALFKECAHPKLQDEWIRYAEEHRDIIVRFGRFPHRNEALGRSSTEEEIAYLRESGQNFGFDPATREAQAKNGALSGVGAFRIFTVDLAAARSFYSDPLGLAVKAEGPGYCVFDTGGIDLVIEAVETGDDADRALVGRFTGLSFAVDDAVIAHACLGAKGVAFQGPPERQPWGGTIAHFEDPAGNVLTIASAPPSEDED